MKSRRGVIKEPMGVIGSIVPWNYPLEVTLNKLGPILATGNTTIINGCLVELRRALGGGT